MKYYIIPSYKCNLQCQHCFIRFNQDKFQKKLFFSQLKLLNGQLILFGGQPLLNYDIFKRCLQTNSFSSISTNLLLLNQKNLQDIIQNNLYVATSWNKFRFTKQQFQIWNSNLLILQKNNIQTCILITLTNDLLKYTQYQLIKIIESFNCKEILFQPVLNISKQQVQQFDNLLCKLEKIWPSNIKNRLKQHYLNKYINNCKDVYTLLPNGKLVNNCPMQINKFYILNQCLSCKYNKICRPCILQKNCSFFKKYYNLING